MKKYIKPAIAEVALDNESILAGSITANDEQGNGQALGRGFDLAWEDDDED